MTKLAKQLAERAEQVKHNVEAERIRAEQLATKTEYERGEKSANNYFSELIEKIEQATEKGERCYYDSVQQWSNNYRLTHSQHGYIDRMVKLLTDEGFKVEVDHSKMDPVGSDPMFFHTVYDCDLVITW